MAAQRSSAAKVDAWSGLDPHMAASELQAGSKLIYRNKDFNTYGFLNAREEFVSKYPETTKKLITLYERAKQWVIDSPDQAAQILSDAAQLPLDVAKRELNERMNFKTSGIPGEAHLAVLRAVIPAINAEQLANPGANLEKAVTDLIDRPMRGGDQVDAPAPSRVLATTARDRLDPAGRHLGRVWGSVQLGVFAAHQLPPPPVVLDAAIGHGAAACSNRTSSRHSRVCCSASRSARVSRSRSAR